MSAAPRNTAVAVLATCFALNMFGRGLGESYAVFLLPLEREFDWSRSELTGMYAIYLLVSGFAAPLVGMLFDRAGPRWVYGSGVSCIAAAFLLAGSLTRLWQFYLLIGVTVGIGVSLTGMVSASALLSRWYQERLSRAIGAAFSAMGIGIITFVPLAQYLVGHYGWRSAYRALGALLAALLPVVVIAVPWRRFAAGHSSERPSGRSASQSDWTLRAAARTRIYWGMAQAFFFTATGMFAIMVQLVAFFVDAGFSPLAAATAYGVCGMLSAGSVMGSGFLVERFGYTRTVTASFAATMTGMVLLLALAAHPSGALLAAFVLIFGMAMGVRGPIISSICARHFAGANVATIYGTIFATNSLGAALGSLVGGALHDLTGGYAVGLGFSLAAIGIASMPFWTVPALRDFR
ncbi:MAG TPA: MFS transporter [Burkholderiales bacterium]|nr:MFS transporter [Burkholderiales bacterium]